MDVKYAYYSTSKGYRVVGGTAAHFLKADGSLDSKEYIDKNSEQTIDSTKTIGIQNTIYSGWDRSSVANPQMGPISLLNLALQGAYPLYGDEEFRNGTNNIAVYNNYGNGNVTMTREAASNLPNKSGMQLRFNYNGSGATPGLGGFILGFMARTNAVFIQKFMAKLPVGYLFNNAENYMGANASVTWLTSRAGTGKWETYVRAVMCGTGTGFGTGGHVYVSGPNTALEFYLAFAEIYEVNSSVFSRIKEAFYAKNETIHFNGAISDLITVGDSYTQKKLLSTSWDGTNGDQILLRVPGNQNNGAYLRYSQNGTLNGNIGLLGSDNLTGGQILNSQGDILYLGNPALPNMLLQTTTNTQFNYAGVGSIYNFNVNGVYLDRNINFNQDNSGVNFFDGGKIYKKAGGGVHINKGNNGLDPRIENADGSQSWVIFHGGNHSPFKSLRNGAVLEDVSESGIYRQEVPTSGFNYTTTLNLNSSDGRQQLTIERTGKGMKFRGTPTGSGNASWSEWRDVYHTGNFNPANYITQLALNTQLGNYAALNGVQTFTNTNTFQRSPVIPPGTLGTHAVNVNQLSTKASGQENATAVGFSSGNVPTSDGNSFPYMYHNSGLYVALATQSYLQTNFLSTPNGTSVIISGSNLNNYLKTGFYRGSGLTNAPFNNTGWWYVTVETHDGTWVTQKATSFGSGNTSNISYQRTMAGGNWSDWAQVWTAQDFTATNIQQWNYMAQYGLQLNSDFSVNTGSALAIGDGQFGAESGVIDFKWKALVAAKRKEYYCYGSEHDGWSGLNYHGESKLFGMGRESNKYDKLTVEGSVKASKNFKSEEENPDTMFIPNGRTATLKDEIINDQSDPDNYAVRLDPHEYEFASSGNLYIDDRNRLLHIIGEKTKMVASFKEIYPKQQIVIYNFDSGGGTMGVDIYGKRVYNISAGCSLRLYVTRSRRVIAEQEQKSKFIWP
ncbi:pyocin knob domain-containing protein [Chryseobacterium sp. MEBOG07]|uniref:pyocin knob domain-containing protein n=1 Tax=Chryseobacterium sp. MEBOG07 TaxID=2879939 RepID=UPI001F3E2EF7|nr:pyocin knob domain-containing protein [Chryseobacterium sp. MEBOG07]UKB81225.1 pyocin knob domain-containing protein [Chryseobacterium sp. MEBOG07]